MNAPCTDCRNSSALPELKEAANADAPKRKQSLLLPAQISFSNPKQGGLEPSAANAYKRSNSLLNPGKPTGAAPKKEPAHLNNSNQKKKLPLSKQSQSIGDSSSDLSDNDLTPGSYARMGGGTSSTTAAINFSSKQNFAVKFDK